MTGSAVDPFDRHDINFNTLQDWSWIGCYGGYYLQSDLLYNASFEHGFFTRLWQGRGPDELAGYISAGVTVHRTQQVHSGRVLPASKAKGDPWPEADGLVSDQGGQSLWVCGADCTPVLIADPITGHAAACHVGWRGVAARILPEAIRQLETVGAKRSDLLIALGPAISGVCYQVGGEVIDAVTNSLISHHNQNIQSHRISLQAEVLLPDDMSECQRLDIRGAATIQLCQEGIKTDKISRCPLCTLDNPNLFHSWRRDQVEAVQWSGIVAQASVTS
ncbi:peptidoglycan editing factor PgeF [Synechococcus sp. M16CYN]|uniref:peptidoglycan editing factor PgeF n=1 Tax=Synechococcus sp. M16CYN TaxID=3103139 RepID=UPI0032472517